MSPLSIIAEKRLCAISYAFDTVNYSIDKAGAIDDEVSMGMVLLSQASDER